MKKVMTSAIALAMLAGTPALAQDRDRDNNREDRRENRQQQAQDRRQDNRQDNRQDARRQDNRQDARRDAVQDRRQDPRQNPRVQQHLRQDRVQDARQRDRVQDQRRTIQNQRDRIQNQQRRIVVDRRDTTRWARRARTFDNRVYRRAFVSPRRYRIGVYVRPSGYYYRRWSHGAYFPRAFWGRNYWLMNWAIYGLLSPPYGYEWVRYGPDAVLVDVRTGMILQVRYNVFW